MRVATFVSATALALTGAIGVQGTTLSDQFNHARVVSAVGAQLAAKGLKQITGFSTGWGPYRFGADRSGTARTEEILTGTLAVDLVDSRTRTIVWRGIASKEVDVKADPRKRERNINRTAERLFKNYPPVR